MSDMEEGVKEGVASQNPAEGVNPASNVGAAVVVLADMLFASRVRATGAACGVAVVTVSRPDRFLDQSKALPARLLIMDLEVHGHDVAALIRAVKADAALRDIPLVAFASHLNAAAIAGARAAGADRVLARSAFVELLPRLLSET